MRYVLVALVWCGCGAATNNNGDMNANLSDMTPAVDSGLQALGTMCTTDGQCQSGICAPYKMGTYKLCTERCTVGQAAPQCTAPSDGTCNGMGYCRFPGM